MPSLALWRMQWLRALIMRPDLLLCETPFADHGLDDLPSALFDELGCRRRDDGLALLWLLRPGTRVAIPLDGHERRPFPEPAAEVSA